MLIIFLCRWQYNKYKKLIHTQSLPCSFWACVLQGSL